jgi:hypothetical protein
MIRLPPPDLLELELLEELLELDDELLELELLLEAVFPPQPVSISAKDRARVPIR